MKIRYSRMKKMKVNKRGIKIATQVAASWYVLFFTVGYLSSNTGAYFSDQAEVTGTITAGVWDDYTLDFINKGVGLAEINSPQGPFSVATKIKNIGSTNMTTPVKYELYYSENGNPEQNGKKVSEGDIPTLAANQEYEIKTNVEKEGTYIFKTFVKSDKQAVVWSEKIKVKVSKNNAQQAQPSPTTQATNPAVTTQSQSQAQQAPATNTEQQTTTNTTDQPASTADTSTQSSETTNNQTTQPTQEEGQTTNETNNN